MKLRNHKSKRNISLTGIVSMMVMLSTASTIASTFGSTSISKSYISTYEEGSGTKADDSAQTISTSSSVVVGKLQDTSVKQDELSDGLATYCTSSKSYIVVGTANRPCAAGRTGWNKYEIRQSNSWNAKRGYCETSYTSALTQSTCADEVVSKGSSTSTSTDSGCGEPNCGDRGGR